MRVCVFGAGYVGLVAAACLAELGHEVACVEVDPARRRQLSAGDAPFWEPGLEERLTRGLRARRLTVVEDAREGLASAEIAIVAVGTPADPQGRPDLSAVNEVCHAIVEHGARGVVVVVKSTVPPGTADDVRASLERAGRADVEVVSNPEFLAEGDAVAGFLRPDRVVLGGRSAEAIANVERLYLAVLDGERPILRMDNTSAELAKYAANAHLAARVSLMNELAQLAESTGADIEQVRRVVAHDPRVGGRYLAAGPGFGGSCFPKDLLALEELGRRVGRPTHMVTAARRVNEAQRLHPVARLEALLGDAGLAGTRVAVWGLAFKPDTDDVRESPALVVVAALLAAGASVVAHDPAASGAARAKLGASVEIVDDPLVALEGADALVLMTEWPVYRQLDPRTMGRRMRRRIVVDARNALDAAALSAAGFSWAGTGRGPRAQAPLEGA
jgi:UDPglucose 6-dehydrogenase